MKVTDKAVLVEMLTTGIYEVRFDKVDGSERIMLATLIPSYLDKVPENDVTDPLIRVFDLENNEIRSFYVANVKNVSKIDPDMLTADFVTKV